MASTENRTAMCVYCHDNVLVSIAGHHEHEGAIYNGQLKISHIATEVLLDWCPAHEMEKFETSDWEEFPSPTVVGFNNSTDTVEIKHPVKKKLQMTFEVYDIKSYRLVKEEDVKLTFYLKDGATPHSFLFPNQDEDCLINALQKYVMFRQSNQDKTLFVVVDPNEEALEKSFSELQLFDYRKDRKDIVKKFLNDPYTMAMDGFSKVSNGLCNYFLNPIAGRGHSQYPDSEMAEFLNEQPSFSSLDSNHIDDFEVIPRVLPKRPEVKRWESLTADQWNLHIDQKNGKIRNVRELKKKIFHGGISPSIRNEVWKFLLGYHEFKSSTKDRELTRKQKLDDYYRMKLQWKSMNEDQESRFASFRDKKSLIKKDVERTDRLHPDFTGPNSQPLAMMYDILMTYCMYNFDLGYVQGMSDLLSPLLVMIKNEPDVFWCFSGFIDKVGVNFEMDQQGMKTQLEQLHTIIHFWDTEFSEYLGMRLPYFHDPKRSPEYRIQMSLWPIGLRNPAPGNNGVIRLFPNLDYITLARYLRLTQRESQLEFYFEMHESGNLYFFFRWLLILFKRELQFEDVMKVWEVLWTDLPCKNFHLLLCLAIIDPEKNTIMENNFGLCEILKHVNDMALKINIEQALCTAEGIYLQFLECEHTPPNVQQILGLPEKKVEEKPSKSVWSPPISAKTENANGHTSPMKGLPTNFPYQEGKSGDIGRRQDISPKSSSSVDTSSIEVLSDDIESRYEISFGLLM